MAEVAHSPPPPSTRDESPSTTTTTELDIKGTSTNVDEAGDTAITSSEEADPSSTTKDTPLTSAPPPPQVDPAEQKRIQESLKTESRKRGNRMFGMMLGTLNRAKRQVETSVSSDAMRHRLELEKKLQDKLQGERKALMEKGEKEKEVRELKATILKKEEEIAQTDAIYRTRHDAKYNLAGFLCTAFPLPTPPTTTDLVSVPFTPRLPHASNLHTSNGAGRPIYYLPRRLLPSQEDRIEDQIEQVKKACTRDREEWKTLKKGKVDEIKALKEELDEKREVVERIEREERQRRRREKEEREEQQRTEKDSKRRRTESGTPAADDVKMNGDVEEVSVDDESKEKSAGSAAMETDSPRTSNGAEDSAEKNDTPSTKEATNDGKTEDQESKKMDIASTVAGEEDLEY